MSSGLGKNSACFLAAARVILEETANWRCERRYNMLLIQNAHIKTMAGADIPNGCLLVENGKIAAVAPEIDAPADAKVIDAQGRLLTPGCVEAHCHIGLDNQAMRWEGMDYNEIVDPLTPQLRAIDSINPQDEAFGLALRGGVTTACTGPGSANVVGGTFAILKLAGKRVDKMVLRSPAAMKCAFGENPKGCYGQGKKQSPMTRMAVAGLLRELLMRTIRYRDDKAAGKNPPLDVKLEAMLPVVNREIPIKCHAHRADDILTAVRIAHEFNLKLTLDHCTDGEVIADELAEEGTVSLALGLGKYIVDGGMTLRFSPYHPNQVLQTSEMEIALKETQTRFYALDLKNAGHDFSIDDGFNLLKLHVKEAENDGALRYIASTYDPYDQIIRDGLYPGGRKVITFANILQHDVFPLARILQLVLKYGEQEMRRPVEIEFAATLSREHDKSGTFYLLQIRPIVDSKEMLDEDLNEIPDENVILRSYNSLGHGIMNEVYDVVYVKTDNYSASNNQTIAWEIEKINQQFLNEGKNYILVGPGRWGSSDAWLGIPVKWPHISAARVIVEAGLTNYRVDPSQGTHFFQNLTSFGVGYFTINAFMNDGVYNQDFLNAQPAVQETNYLRHVRFEKPVVVKMDGKKKLGVVLMPGVDK